MLTIGSKAPSFALEGTGGKTVRLEDYRGRFALLVFYPKNNTPG